MYDENCGVLVRQGGYSDEEDDSPWNPAPRPAHWCLVRRRTPIPYLVRYLNLLIRIT